MKPVQTIIGQAVPLGTANVDTDIILPAPYLKTITRRGLGNAAFEAIRARPGNIFDDERYRRANIIVAGANFGCGSSREHAIWAMVDMGIEAVIATSFSDIFAGNAFRNGLLTIEFEQTVIDRLLERADEGEFIIELDSQTLHAKGGEDFCFDFDPFKKHCLLNGLDEIGLTLQHEQAIANFEERLAMQRHWLPPSF